MLPSPSWDFQLLIFLGICTHWEELSQYEPISDFPTDGAVETKRLDRRHTYQFLMGLKPEFEALRTQILNIVPLPSLFEAFATVEGDERRRRIVAGLLMPDSVPSPSPSVPDQMALLLLQALGPLVLVFSTSTVVGPAILLIVILSSILS